MSSTRHRKKFVYVEKNDSAPINPTKDEERYQSQSLKSNEVEKLQGTRSLGAMGGDEDTSRKKAVFSYQGGSNIKEDLKNTIYTGGKEYLSTHQQFEDSFQMNNDRFSANRTRPLLLSNSKTGQQQFQGGLVSNREPFSKAFSYLNLGEEEGNSEESKFRGTRQYDREPPNTEMFGKKEEGFRVEKIINENREEFFKSEFDSFSELARKMHCLRPFALCTKNDQEKWYYVDNLGLVQGPFSCIEMDTWYNMDTMYEDLPIAKDDNTHFKPLKFYLEIAVKKAFDLYFPQICQQSERETTIPQNKTVFRTKNNYPISPPDFRGGLITQNTSLRKQTVEGERRGTFSYDPAVHSLNKSYQQRQAPLPFPESSQETFNYEKEHPERRFQQAFPPYLDRNSSSQGN